jgi:hypothetical protein
MLTIVGELLFPEACLPQAKLILVDNWKEFFDRQI